MKNSIGIVFAAQMGNAERGQGHMEELRAPARAAAEGNALWVREMGVVGKPGELEQQLPPLNATNRLLGRRQNSGKTHFILFVRKVPPAQNTWPKYSAPWAEFREFRCSRTPSRAAPGAISGRLAGCPISRPAWSHGGTLGHTVSKWGGDSELPSTGSSSFPTAQQLLTERARGTCRGHPRGSWETQHCHT